MTGHGARNRVEVGSDFLGQTPTPYSKYLFFLLFVWKAWFSMVNTAVFSRVSASYPEKNVFGVGGMLKATP